MHKDKSEANLRGQLACHHIFVTCAYATLHAFHDYVLTAYLLSSLLVLGDIAYDLHGGVTGDDSCRGPNRTFLVVENSKEKAMNRKAF